MDSYRFRLAARSFFADDEADAEGGENGDAMAGGAASLGPSGGLGLGRLILRMTKRLQSGKNEED